MTRKAAWVLIASAVWTFYVWISRVFNIARGSGTTAFKTVHYVLALVSLVFAAAVGTIGVRSLKRRGA